MSLRIKEIMEEKGVKSVVLAEMISISTVSVSNLLNGKLKPSFDTLEKIAVALDVPMWQLFASPSEVKEEPEQDRNVITCPKCGSKFKLEE